MPRGQGAVASAPVIHSQAVGKIALFHRFQRRLDKSVWFDPAIATAKTLLERD